MRYSKSITKTLREAPVGAESSGYKALLRAGYIKQLGAGIFDLLPFGLKSIRKIENIIRTVMNECGGQEVLLPVVNPAEIWKKTGRFYSIGDEMTRLNDRNGKDIVLAMTHEEAVTELATSQIDSYKKLPCLIYQIQTKWRDDPRPRAGLIRVREFTMKDAYSFHTDQESLEEMYDIMYKAYFKIFGLLGIDTIAVASDSGMMGGKIAHEYMYLSPIGEDTIITCPKCGYTANKQVAVFDKNTNKSKEKEKPLELVKTPKTKTIEEVCNLLKVRQEKCAKAVFFTATFSKEGKDELLLVLALIRGDLDVEENKLQNAIKANDLRPAREDEITPLGFIPGFAGPVGVDNSKYKLVVDDSLKGTVNLVTGANKADHHYINFNINRDIKAEFYDIASAKNGCKCAKCGAELQANRGVEVGNIFQLGTKYSQSFNLFYQGKDSQRKPVIMGCYGIGVGRALGCLAEQYNDEAGLKLPITVAPFEVTLISLITGADSAKIDKIYDDLITNDIDVLYDDRDENAGVKFTDSELIGSPITIVIGKKGLSNGFAEVSLRKDKGNKKQIPLDKLTSEIYALKSELKSEIFNKVKNNK